MISWVDNLQNVEGDEEEYAFSVKEKTKRDFMAEALKIWPKSIILGKKFGSFGASLG